MEHTDVSLREYRWHTFSRRLARRAGVTIITIAAYPTTILGAVITAVVVLAPDTEVLIRDFTVIGTVLFCSFLAAAPSFRRLRVRHRWFAMVAGIVAAMEVGNGFLPALRATGDRTGADIAAAIRNGNNPAYAFSRYGSPENVVTALKSAVSESDLRERLERDVRDYQEEAFRRLVHMERVLQPSAIGLAGAAVIWMVVRVVIPTLVARMGPVSGL